MGVEQKLDHKWKSILATPKDSENQDGCFDCNICLDFANDPVVTLCGHLFCWACLYKWFHIQSASLPSDEYPQCPVCKAEISHTTVIPLYGRGQSNNSGSRDLSIPPRPPACGTRALLTAASQPRHRLPPYRNPYQIHEPFVHSYTDEISSSPSPLFNGVGSVFQPVGGMFGEMMYARVFGNSQSLYSYPNSYQVVGSSTRGRREMHVDKSLSRVSLFLVCCLLLCLFLF